jgi:molybdenum cofactor biosynthesis enzyme MoaA
MNVLLNNYCNLKCSYCFANDVIDREKQSLSLADFRYVLKFHEKSSIHQLNIIGGEPTLHPKFNELLEMVAKADHIREVLIFTNGNVYPKQREAIANLARVKQVGMLINYNAPQLLPPGVEQRIHDCIKFLKDDVIFTLGICWMP